MITQDYIDGLTRQVFIKDYILNGLFPSQSDIVRSIRSKKVEWQFNDRFEYRMLLANTNTGGSINSQIFNNNVSLLNPNSLTYGIFKATYGAVSDGFDVDMTVNLQTSSDRGAFINEYSMLVHSMRFNVASLFKNFAIHGRFGVLHRISNENVTQAGGTPVLGQPFTIRTPINVYASTFKTGRYLIKTSSEGAPAGAPNPFVPWGPANVGEVYMVLDNQPRSLTLLPMGTVVTAWLEGQFLEVFGNRSVIGQHDWQPTWGPAPGTWAIFTNPNWQAWAQYAGQGQLRQMTGTGQYTNGASAGTGAMEGIADLFPYHIDPTTGNRAGLELPFRNQANRLFFSTEQAGGFFVREPNMSIIDAIMQGVSLVTATVPHADVGVWMNPDTMLAMGEQETQDVRWVKQIIASNPIVFQRGITSHDYQVGSRLIPATIQDHNMPTNIVIIGPRDDLSYNCWAQDMYKIDEYVQETFAKVESPRAEDIKIPPDFATRLDFARRITYGAPSVGNHRMTTDFLGGNFVHPTSRLPIAFHEMGALFTEAPFAYAVVNLRHEIVQPSDVHKWPD